MPMGGAGNRLPVIAGVQVVHDRERYLRLQEKEDKKRLLMERQQRDSLGGPGRVIGFGH